MSENKGQHEPSMEEILASIRRIIAEDGEQPLATPPGPAAAPAAPAAAVSPESPTRDDEILELTEIVEEGQNAAEGSTTGAVPAELDSTLTNTGGRLVSEAAAAASLAALSQLQQLEPRNEQRVSDIPMGEGQRTIEDMVREMLRPLLKEWLDSNLPHIVERVVQEEVSRLVRDVRRR
jgi:cell pole-organizing protein PopZ